MKKFFTLSILMLFMAFGGAMSALADPCPPPVEPTAAVEELGKQVSDVSEFTCDQRREYVHAKLQSATSPRDFIAKIAKHPPQLLIFGNHHALLDQIVWYDDIRDFYKKMNPALDCVLEESELDPIANGLYEVGPSLLKKHKSIRKAVEAYALEKGVAFKPFEPDENGEFSMQLGENTYLHSADLRWYFENGVKLIAFDDRSHLGLRDQRMAEYVERLFKFGQCHSAIANLGQLHLPVQKRLLKEKGIDSLTVGFEALNAYERKFCHPMLEGCRMIRNASFLDFNDCQYLDKPTSSFAVYTQDIEAPIVAANGINLRWNSFDAHIVAPVIPTGPTDDFVEKSTRILR